MCFSLGVLCLPLLYYASLCVLISFANYIEEEERAGYIAFVVFRMSCYYKCSVTIPQGALGWSVLCECGIS